ncbi:hypothetical protein [Citrobacter enshiensis]|uniref:Uncharacterized protein n=1 Tax=Citrobacter enshiensis TaxID=2971264 RepID=A0ABT8PSK2_9ENTR|nr:hypothetical protein [Citrobacter enshiensis]MDN8599320.1 hypothetical protein [Citrobacter enshiensis]WET41967.1 hypothetical protein P2W74_07050 [Citrobacter enshiensis]
MASISSPKYDSAFTFTGLDFIARSMVMMETNGTYISLAAMTGNMTNEQKEILTARWEYHQSRRNVSSNENQPLA